MCLLLKQNKKTKKEDVSKAPPPPDLSVRVLPARAGQALL